MGRQNETNGAGSDRDQRLKQALKANLQRRKAQARIRSTEVDDAGGAAGDSAVDNGPTPEREAGHDG